jgi:glycosyltransferase involved in cell wall biosynthesis
LSTKFNVLFLCGWYPSKVSPNNGDFIQRHAEAVSLNHKVTVIHIVTDRKTKKNIEYTSVKINGIETHIAYLKYSNNPLKKIFFFIKAFKVLLLKSQSIDVVHLNEIFPFGIFSLYLKWFKKKPYIISEHFTGYHYPQSENISFFQKIISSIITRNASFVCPVSNDLKKSMQKLGLKGKYHRVPNVVDTNLFYPKENTNSVFKIIHISNMNNEHKNIEGILRVVSKIEKEIDDFQFKIIGENSDKYFSYAKKININLEKTLFIKQIPHKEVAKNLQESNLFLLFSNYENLPCVILESFSCGVPVITTNVGGISEFFPEDFGFLINIKDENAMLENVLKVYKNFKIDKNKMHTYVKKEFSETSIAQQFTKLYTSTLNTNSTEIN